MRRFARLSPATVIACIALLVALGGTSVAAVSIVLPPNSVGTAQLKNNAVVSGKVQNGSLRRADFGPGQLPAGPAGPQGPAGPAGPAGPGARWALVRPDGSVIAQSGGVTLTAKPGVGSYILDFGTSVAGKLLIVASARASDPDFRGTVSVSPCGGTTEGVACSAGNDINHVNVITNDAGEKAREDHAFYVAVIG
jgi:hypothetical protein